MDDKTRTELEAAVYRRTWSSICAAAPTCRIST